MPSNNAIEMLNSHDTGEIFNMAPIFFKKYKKCDRIDQKHDEIR